MLLLRGRRTFGGPFCLTSRPEYEMAEAVETVAAVEESKAVQVARDVLAHMSCYNVRTGAYLTGIVPRQDVIKDGDLQDNLEQVATNCNVCALGAMLLSKARLYDDVPMRAVLGQGVMSDYKGPYLSITMERRNVVGQLEDVFGWHQLAMIESAFEMKHMNTTPMTAEQADRLCDAVNFGISYAPYHSHTRLKAIMENVIENNGVFNPPNRRTVTQAKEKS